MLAGWTDRHRQVWAERGLCVGMDGQRSRQRNQTKVKNKPDFPGKLSKWLLLINFLLTTPWQGCRLIRNPSPMPGSYPDLATHGRSPQIGAIWQPNVPDEAAQLVGKCGQLGMSSPARSRALSSLLPSLPANKRALSANHRHFSAAKLGQLKSEVEIRTPGSHPR